MEKEKEILIYRSAKIIYFFCVQKKENFGVAKTFIEKNFEQLSLMLIKVCWCNFNLSIINVQKNRRLVIYSIDVLERSVLKINGSKMNRINLLKYKGTV